MQLQCGQCGFAFELEADGPAGPVLCPNCGRVMPNPTGASDPVTEVAQALVGDDAEAGFAEIARKGLARKMRVICSLCGKHLVVSKFSAGQTVGCPACRRRIRIPEIAADEDVDVSRLTSAAAAEADRVSLADALQNRGRRRLRGTSQRVRGSVRKLTAPVAAAAVAACVLALLYLALSSNRLSPPTRRIPSGPQAAGREVEAGRAGRLEPPEPIAASDIQGEYVRQPPADAEAMPGGAVAAALLAAPEHRLIVRSDGEGLEVSIQAAGVSGSARPIRAGLYAVQLGLGQDSLSCKLRFIDAGKRVILYLSEEPSGWLIYDRR